MFSSQPSVVTTILPMLPLHHQTITTPSTTPSLLHPYLPFPPLPFLRYSLYPSSHSIPTLRYLPYLTFLFLPSLRSKCRHAGIVEMEASIKATQILILQKKFLLAHDFLQNVIYINLQVFISRGAATL